MGLNWTVLEHGRGAAWDAAIGASSYATFFQSRQWAELIARTFPQWSPDPVVVEFSDGNAMVLPALRHKRTGYRESMVPHVYGGPVFLQPPTGEHLEAAASAPTWFSDVTLIDNLFAPYRQELQGLARWQLETTATDLTSGFDTLWARFRDTHKRHYKAALKRGASVAIADSSEDADAYYAIYRASLDRWGDGATGFYPRQLFRNIVAMPESGKGIHLRLAKLNGAVIGGIVTVYHGTQATYWHGVSADGETGVRPSPFLLIDAIQDACSNGFHWFDLMGPNEHLRGVQHFKDGFASQRLPYNAYYALNSIRGILFSRFRKLKERRLRRCPL